MRGNPYVNRPIPFGMHFETGGKADMSNPEDVARVSEIKSLLDRIQQLPLAPQEQTANAHYQQWAEDDRRPAAADGYARSGKDSTLSPWLFVLATALNTIIVAVLAVLITLGVVRQEPARDGDQSAAGQTAARPWPAADPRDVISTTSSVFTTGRPAPVRSVDLQPIGSPEEPLRLEAGKASRLPLQIQPEDASQESFILVLSGLPAGSDLLGARRIGSDSWLLPPNSIARLEVMLAEWSTSLIEADVELRRIDGSFAARTKAWIAVPPPAFARVALKLDQAALKELLKKGDQLLGRGDIVGARAVYERAAEMGSSPAALTLGSTYDPNRLWSLGVFGMVGNKERARQWYARADQLGHPSAKDRLKSLED